MHTKKVRSMKIQTRLMISFIAFILVVTSIGDAVLFYQDMKLLMSDLKKDVCDLAASASLLVDGDMIKRVESSGDMSSEEYMTIRDDLREFQEATGVTYIYTLAGNGEDQTRFIVDADPEEPGALGEDYDYFDGMTAAFDGSASANKSVYTDEWDTLLSGYAPIKDSDGNVAAILAVDISAETILAKQLLFLKNFAIKAFFTVILVIIMTSLICRRITRPIHLLENSLKELSTSGGDLTKTIEIHTGDEIESLGNSINAFIANIRQIIGKAAEVSEQVITGSSSLENAIIQSTNVLEQNTIAIQTIASGTVNQVTDIDAVTNRVMSMSKELEESDKQIDLINETITLSEEHINTGTHIVQELNAKTDTNLMAFSDVDRKIGHLVTDVNGISEILQRISYVSYQINLLALNAGIEAARAGEAGNGFSVVANEIKKLAAQTAQSVSEVD